MTIYEIIGLLIALINCVVLSITLFFLIKYTRATEKYTQATEKMAQYQITPTIDVNMVYDKNEKKTYFWFSNESNFPGFVYLERKKNDEKRVEVYSPLRISPKEKGKKTATAFDFSPVYGDRLIIYISIKPALEKSNIKFEFEKSYSFSDDKWNETSWSFPDMPFPFPAELKKCPECKSNIPVDAKRCRYCKQAIN